LGTLYFDNSRKVDSMSDLSAQVWAVDALGALAHETRLSVFRMLVQAGPDGMIAGAIADRTGVPPSTMSHHLATLERTGLVQSERESRLIHYRADYPGMRRLLMFLMQDCCQGAPEMCGDLVSELTCNPASKKDTA
jgi:ArsR family transcriptional regulator